MAITKRKVRKVARKAVKQAKATRKTVAKKGAKGHTARALREFMAGRTAAP